MNKTELVNEIASAVSATKTEASRFLEAFIDVVTHSLRNGEQVVVTGFGTLSVDERAERDGRHPQTGQTIRIPAKKVVKFKAGNVLKETVQK